MMSSSTLLRRCCGIILALLLGLCGASHAADRVVVVGDVHGSLEGLTGILRETGLLDSEGRWSGGDATLIQIGDLLDRGPEVAEVCDLLMRLTDEADGAGGEVEVLLGNHEAMNLLGIVRDVSPEAFRTFVDERSEDRRRQAWERFTRHQVTLARELGLSIPVFADADRERFLADLPPGRLEYLEAFSSRGSYGSWLRERPVAVLRNGTLFIHAGLSPVVAGLGVAEINARVRDELRRWDEAHQYMVQESLILPWESVQAVVPKVAEVLEVAAEKPRTDQVRAMARHARQLQAVADIRSWFLVSSEGPLWFRGAALWDEGERGEEMAALLDGIGARRMVVGHSTMRDHRIATRFGGRVVLVDTGMLSSHYQGVASALEIVDGIWTAVYPGQREVLLDATGQPVLPAPLVLEEVGVRP